MSIATCLSQNGSGAKRQWSASDSVDVSGEGVYSQRRRRRRREAKAAKVAKEAEEAAKEA
eukprot:COSAG05_NODE_13104_length_441_cov_1.532164_2_plen_59_part_01